MTSMKAYCTARSESGDTDWRHGKKQSYDNEYDLKYRGLFDGSFATFVFIVFDGSGAIFVFIVKDS